MSTRWGRTRD